MQPYKIVPVAVSSVEMIQTMVPQVNFNGSQLQNTNYNASQYNISPRLIDTQMGRAGPDNNRAGTDNNRAGTDNNRAGTDNNRARPGNNRTGFNNNRAGFNNNRAGGSNNNRSTFRNRNSHRNSRNSENVNNLSVSHSNASNEAPRPSEASESSNATKKPTHRVTKNQPGSIKYFLLHNTGRIIKEIPPEDFGNKFRPSNVMSVTWQLPSKDYYAPQNVDLVIGLARYGSTSNNPCVVTKHLHAFGKDLNLINTTDMFGNNIVEGKIQFHAPKAGGYYVFRMFEQRERSLITLATSAKFFVELLDSDITTNLGICSTFFASSSFIRAISQLQTIGGAMQNFGRMTNGENAQTMLRRCTDAAIKVLEDVIHVNPNDDSESGKNKNRLHVEIHDAFRAFRTNSYIWTLLSDSQKSTITKFERLYCPFFNRFFSSVEELQSLLLSVFDFSPDNESEYLMKGTIFPTTTEDLEIDYDRLIDLDKNFVKFINQSIRHKEVVPKKESTRKQLENILRESSFFPQNSELLVLSDPIFMMDESDLELILNLPSGPEVHIDDRIPILRRLVDIFSSFEGVSVKIVNRLAYLQLKDHISNLKCNISLKNPIVDHSIMLLKAYCEIDDRVVVLMTFLKAWTKARAIKTSSQGYLSEYGYVLCLIHYLQNRTQPILPSLQKLPQSWTGGDYSRNNNHQDFIINPLDNSVVDCYVYPIYDAGNIQKLKSVASRNTESVISLLYGFFKFYSMEFDYRLSVVSVRLAKGIPKLDKAEEDGWPINDRLSIEDPLEPSYDVAFNIKVPQVIKIRKEMLRAYKIIKKGDDDMHDSLLTPV